MNMGMRTRKSTKIDPRAVYLEQGVDLATRSFIITGQVTDNTVLKVYNGLKTLEAYDTGPIRMYLCSDGGDVESGLGAYDLLRSSPCEIEIVIVGCAKSMGSIILQAADRRLMTPSSTLMCHWGQISIEDTNPDNFKRNLEYQETLDTVCNKIILERMKEVRKRLTIQKVKELTALDWYLTPKEAIKVGLADAILEHN